MFRNRLKTDIQVKDYSHRCNVAGNTVLGSGGIAVQSSVQDILLAYNRLDGVLKHEVDGPQAALVPSL